MRDNIHNNSFGLVRKEKVAKILVEAGEYEGVKKIAEKSARDIEIVTGILPEVISELPQECKNVVLYATIGKSKILEELKKTKKISFTNIKDKREVYGIKIVEQPFEGINKMLVIYGSEKRGTIYGIFTLSQKIGVSPLVFWGDAMPAHRIEIILGKEVEEVSKEPSVKYRGFFINDEWPCFGNWTFNHYGGFTAKMYDKVYELLLRLKGNYLWPAMWTSSFALDGPGEENAKLADIYGVIIGNSHHEPCLRASEEWDIYRGTDSIYGNEWNYITNKEGLLKYWEDGIKRSGKYESIVTLGMRGERDSIMEGTKTLQDNIDVLKDIIENQTKILNKYVKKETPRLLAIYKEVEEFYYGNDDTEGLKEWEGLDSIILMLCEDNYGNMRSLPDKKMLEHTGGYGMYYHFDYHGAPVSYEWVNSTPLSKIWEQMTQCYEHGVREAWIVNVGDLKGNEFPLSYFLELAYDFEKWGTSDIDSPRRYTAKWIDDQFGEKITPDQSKNLQKLLIKGIWLNNLRKPEALNSKVYHPVHYHEANRILCITDQINNLLENLKETLPADCKAAYLSMIYFLLRASMNLIQMHLYAGKNEHYAKQGKKVANYYKDKVSNSIRQDKEISEEFASLFDGKWRGMELAKHIGFVKWNEDGCRYPLRVEVEPFDRPRMVVSRSDRSEIYLKNYGQREQIHIRDFLYPGTQEVHIEVANDGVKSIQCQVKMNECPWISLNWIIKEIESQEILKISCIADKLPIKEEKCTILLSDGDTEIEVLVHGKQPTFFNLPEKTFYEKDGVIAIKANNYVRLVSGETGELKVIKDYGKTGFGLKAFPVTQDYTLGSGPAAVYKVVVEKAGDYNLEVWSAPSNPLKPKGRLYFGTSINDGKVEKIPSVSSNFQGGDPESNEWSNGVLNQIHIKTIEIQLERGINEIAIYAVDAGFVLEGLLIYKKEIPPLPSYLGPNESWHS